MPRDTAESQRPLDTETDHFPSIAKALHQIANEASAHGGQPEHLEIHFLASGEATWRMWIKGEEETVGNVLSV